MIGRTIAHYEILEKLGEGGMGIVCRARDLNLGREVAIKFLPPGALSDESARAMFRREARALARLNHPNIAAVYEFDTVDGVDFLVTEYVAGETLAAHSRAQALSDDAVRRIGLQIAAALRAAHEKGVVHCDLKPGNVIVTPQGVVKLLDFGLARFLHSATRPSDASTQTMVVAGTVPYMAPEQLRGGPPDPRIDIYGAGALLYEIAVGRRPFDAPTQAGLIDAIFHDRPEPPRSIRPAISAGLERAILRCLEKQPELRYSSAALLAADLERAAPDSFRRRAKARLRLLAVSALTLLAVLVVIVSVAGRHPVLSFAPRDWILIADFENHTGDPIFDQSLLTAFQAGLEQSRVVNIFPRSRVRDTLRRMRRTGNERVDDILGEEIASREGIKALIVPSISGVGGQYRLAARIREVSTGADVKTRIVEARSRNGVLTALDRLAAGVRKDLGESLIALSGNSRPMQQVTTASLDALQQFSMAIEKHKAADYKEARLYYEQALKTDPQFTAARSALGMLLFEHFDAAEGARMLKATVEDAARLAPRERYAVLAFHAAAVERDLEKAAGFDRALLASYPDDPAARNNLGLLYVRMGRFQDAVAEYQRALRIDPHFQLTLTNLSYAALFGMGDPDTVIAACSPQLSQDDQDPWMLANLGWAYLAKARLQDAERVFRRSAELFPAFYLNRYRLGMTLRFERRWEPALEAFAGILANDARQCFALYETAVTRDWMGQNEAARREFGRAQACLQREARDAPKDAGTRMLLALVLARLGRPDAAGDLLQSALRLDPTLRVEAAAVLAACGKDQEALDRLEEAVQHGYNNFVWILTHAEFQRFKTNPRFDALLRSHLKGMGSL